MQQSNLHIIDRLWSIQPTDSKLCLGKAYSINFAVEQDCIDLKTKIDVS